MHHNFAPNNLQQPRLIGVNTLSKLSLSHLPHTPISLYGIN